MKNRFVLNQNVNMYSKHSGRHTLWFDKYDPLKTGNTVEEKKKKNVTYISVHYP